MARQLWLSLVNGFNLGLECIKDWQTVTYSRNLILNKRLCSSPALNGRKGGNNVIVPNSNLSNSYITGSILWTFHLLTIIILVYGLISFSTSDSSLLIVLPYKLITIMSISFYYSQLYAICKFFNVEYLPFLITNIVIYPVIFSWSLSIAITGHFSTSATIVGLLFIYILSLLILNFIIWIYSFVPENYKRYISTVLSSLIYGFFITRPMQA